MRDNNGKKDTRIKPSVRISLKKTNALLLTRKSAKRQFLFLYNYV